MLLTLLTSKKWSIC